MLGAFWGGTSRCGLPVLKLLSQDLLMWGWGVGVGQGAEALDGHLVPFHLKTTMTCEVLKSFTSTIRMIGLQGSKILKEHFQDSKVPGAYGSMSSKFQLSGSQVLSFLFLRFLKNLNCGKIYMTFIILTSCKMYISVASSTFTVQCNHHHPPSPELFRLVKPKLHPY